MADLGLGIISTVDSSMGIDLLAQAPVSSIGEKSFFQVSMFDKQLKVKPVEIRSLGKEASVLDPAPTNIFKAR